MNSALEVRDLSKSFKHFNLNDISFSLPIGYIMGLVGQNGAGKTTTIKIMLNMLKKDKGDIEIFGLDVSEHHKKIKQDISVVFDDTYFCGEWKVSDVEKAVSPFYDNWDTVRFNELLKTFHIECKKKVKNLSRGMKMKLMLAVALSHGAKLLILDEPTSGLDPVAREELIDILQEYITKEDCSVLFSTHITKDLERIADYITVLHKGKLFYTGTRDELLESYCIIKGGINELVESFRTKCIGVKKNVTGFSALYPTRYLNLLSKEIISEPVNFDDILVHIDLEEGYE